MEFPDLGKHCSDSFCNRLDFLPVKCDACDKLYCKDHVRYEDHSCPYAYKKNVQVPVCPLCNQPVPVKKGETPDVVVGAHIDRDCQSDPARKKRKAYANRCSYGKCKVKELIPVVCPDCRLNFCLRHRHPQDHQCKGYQDTGRKVSNTGYAALQRLNKTSTSSNNSRQRNNVASVSNVPQRTLLTSLGKDLDRERRQRQQVNARSMNGMSEDEALQQALKASLEQDNNTSTSQQQQEESDLELARRLQREEEEARIQRRLRDQQQRNAAEASSDSRCHVS